MRISISKKIISWYFKHKRTLPWREYKNLIDKHYKVLLSEFMLQQTQVNTVIPYFNKFYKKYPNFKSLTKTSNTSIIKMWQGLGYYRRAKFLQQTAKIIVNQHEGKLPDNYEALINLPGIGDYTAKTLLAIIFNKPLIGIDGNVKRIIQRVFDIKSSKNLLQSVKKFTKKLQCKKFNSELMQGLMEIGSLICKPKNPNCSLCPLTSECLSYKNKSFKLKSNKKITKLEEYFILVSFKNGRYLMTYEDNFGPLKGFLNFPIFSYKECNIKNTLKFHFNYSNEVLFIKKLTILISNRKCNLYLYKMNNPSCYDKKYFYITKKKIKLEFQSSFMKRILKEITHI
ncbi:MAG: hypothetical protein CMI81_02835 [Candidatus Pelagibacter sp.]|nr:hypothetical protein [Candidatus Pelagibacter sp.]OUV97304.1 MAG: hypothetical protein CBD02_03480 [Candidatus Pelagibacter sp. TMED142]